MSFVDKFVAEILTLQIALYHSRARLEAGTNGEALHDLRMSVMRIRSLLRPMRSMSEVTALNNAAAEVGRLTTPARDLEVLIEELEERGFPDLAQFCKAHLDSDYSKTLKRLAFKNLFTQLDEWPSTFRLAEINCGLKYVQPQIEKALTKQIDRLNAAVDDAESDPHELRILVKRTRYLTEAFPKLSPLSGKAASSLKALQSALGARHDHYQWCQKASMESDLRPLEEVWQRCAATALKKAETQLADLAELLPKSSGKKSRLRWQQKKQQALIRASIRARGLQSDDVF